MNNDLISRDATKKTIDKFIGYLDEDMIYRIKVAIDKVPTVEERPQGVWIKEDDEHLEGWYRCSECGRRVEDLTDDVVIHAGCEDYTIADIYPYCHCGAKMKAVQNERKIKLRLWC